MLRVLRYCGTEAIGHRLHELEAELGAAPIIERATSFLREDLGLRESKIVALTVADRAFNETESQVAIAVRTLGARLLGD